MKLVKANQYSILNYAKLSIHKPHKCSHLKWHTFLWDQAMDIKQPTVGATLAAQATLENLSHLSKESCYKCEQHILQ